MTYDNPLSYCRETRGQSRDKINFLPFRVWNDLRIGLLLISHTYVPESEGRAFLMANTHTSPPESIKELNKKTDD